MVLDQFKLIKVNQKDIFNLSGHSNYQVIFIKQIKIVLEPCIGIGLYFYRSKQRFYTFRDKNPLFKSEFLIVGGIVLDLTNESKDDRPWKEHLRDRKPTNIRRFYDCFRKQERMPFDELFTDCAVWIMNGKWTDIVPFAGRYSG
jgi:hypothetical protein